jgi:hypothetical protein
MSLRGSMLVAKRRWWPSNARIGHGTLVEKLRQ